MAKKAELKTKKNTASVSTFLNSIKDPKRKKDAKAVLKLMKEVTGQKAVMWGKSIVGFGTYTYTYASGRTGDWMRIGFSPRQQSLTLYIMPGFDNAKDLMKQLGPYKTGKSCLYIKDLDQIHIPTLKKIMKNSLKEMDKMYGKQK